MAQERTATVEPSAGLLRQLGLTTATALVVSNMIGTGIFVAPIFLAGQLGDPMLVFGVWIAGAVCALAGAFCYSELGVNLPASGGEYVYLTHAYGPSWGFMTGWISFIAGFSAPIAATALAFTGYLGYFFPAVNTVLYTIPIGPWNIRAGWGQVVACSLITFLTVLNVVGLQRSARFQNIFTGVKVSVVLGLIILGFTAGTGNMANLSEVATRTSTTPLLSQFAISLFWVYGSYSGWNAAAYIAEELKNPEKTLPLALAAGTIFVATIFLALNAVFIYAVPLQGMIDLLSQGKVAIGSIAAQKLFGAETASIFGALMAAGLMSSVNAMVTVGPRVYYAMAKNRAFFASAAKVDSRWHTPVNAIVAQGIAAALMTFIAFGDLFMYISFTLNLFAGLSVASLFLFRKRPGWRKLPVVSFLFPLVPGFFLVVSAWMYYVGIKEAPMVTLATGATIGAGGLFYHFIIRERA